MVLDEYLEDDPPLGWEEAQDGTVLADATHEFRSLHRHEQITTSHNPEAPRTGQHGVQMEEVPDSEDFFVENFPGPAGKAYGKKATYFESLHKKQRAGKFGEYGPFAEREEWELAEWMIKSSISQSEMDTFL
jgi:hypothetical protein